MWQVAGLISKENPALRLVTNMHTRPPPISDVQLHGYNMHWRGYAWAPARGKAATPVTVHRREKGNAAGAVVRACAATLRIGGGCVRPCSSGPLAWGYVYPMWTGQQIGDLLGKG
jgi:hypothetical protein